MQAQDVMSTNVVAVGPDAAVAEVAALMVQRRIGGVPVVDADGRLLGMIGEGSFLPFVEGERAGRRSWWLGLVGSPEERAHEHLRLHGRIARDIMTAPAVAVGPATPVAEIARLMEAKQLRRVPVVVDGRVIGIVSRADMLRALALHRTGSPVTADDRELCREVEARLTRAGVDWRHHLNIIVTDGTVHLWGLAASADEAVLFIRLAEEAAGEGRVESHLTTRDADVHLRPGGRYGLV